MRRGSSRPAPVRARLRAEKKTGRGRLRPRRGVDELRVPGARARGLGAVDVVVVARVVELASSSDAIASSSSAASSTPLPGGDAASTATAPPPEVAAAAGAGPSDAARPPPAPPLSTSAPLPSEVKNLRRWPSTPRETAWPRALLSRWTIGEFLRTYRGDARRTPTTRATRSRTPRRAVATDAANEPPRSLVTSIPRQRHSSVPASGRRSTACTTTWIDSIVVEKLYVDITIALLSRPAAPPAAPAAAPRCRSRVFSFVRVPRLALPPAAALVVVISRSAPPPLHRVRRRQQTTSQCTHPLTVPHPRFSITRKAIC
eukprot:31433-Pelagococcus_subviridis.AAC.5